MGETRSNGSQIYLKVQPGRGLSEGGNHSQCKGSSHQRNSQRGHLGFHHCGPGALGRRRLLTGALPAAVPSCLLPSMASCLVPALLLLLLLGSRSSVAPNPCVDAADACTADERCHRLRTAYVAQCLGRAAPGGCPRARCRRALRHFFARGPPALTHALLFCPCGGPACAERRRQTFVPSCAFSGPGRAPPSCLGPLDACEHSRICRPRLLAFQVSCATTASNPDGCLRDQAPSCLRAYAGLVGMHRPQGISRGCLRQDGPITLFSGSHQAQPSRPTTWTTQARAWSPGATAEPAEIGVRSAKSSGGSLRGTAAWTVPYRPLTVGGPQSYVTNWTPTRTLSRVSCRCLLQMRPWRRAPCSPCFLFWLSSPCSDLDSRPWTTVPPCLGYWASLVAYCPTEKGLACLLSWPTTRALLLFADLDTFYALRSTSEQTCRQNSLWYSSILWCPPS
ncbi:GDNF family receptor alpha-4 isoform X2 [Bos javanicus]|uniref:GDNF family receptor alpha-4 isoform X2 n=1 Tax=Bos javanicus TaxID=9906 RepID=UPI002AA89885|nr:GDNF family receptor alpha-4 isoform X2 [Bos javanicus]